MYYWGYRFFGYLLNYGVGGDNNGEKFIIRQLSYFSEKSSRQLLIFDVGGNIGQYALLLDEYIKNKKLYSFEPSKNSFRKLQENTKNIQNYFPKNFWFSDAEWELNLFYSEGEGWDTHNSCASLYKNNITDFVSKNVIEEKIALKTIDNFCESENISNIDYLKIDIEGNEFRALQWAKNMLSEWRIDVIQIEFNRCSVASHIFLKDYWDFLSEKYDIYRLLSYNHGLYQIKKYDTALENFTYINYIFIRKNSDFAKFIK